MKVTEINFPYAKEIRKDLVALSDATHHELDQISYEHRSTLFAVFYTDEEAKTEIQIEGYDKYVHGLTILSEKCLRIGRPLSGPEYQAIFIHCQSQGMSAAIDDIFMALSVDPQFEVDVLFFARSDRLADPFRHYNEVFRERFCGKPIFVGAVHLKEGKIERKSSELDSNFFLS